MKKILFYAAILTLLALLLGAEQQKGLKPRSLSTVNLPTGTPLATMFNINQVAAWYEANGEQERNPTTANAGLYYPRGTATAIYASGLLWGGLFYDSLTPTLRVNGQMYNNGTRPGAILGIRTGVAEDPMSADVRIWRIRPDYATADLKRDAAETLNNGDIPSVSSAQIQQVRAQYADDWANWPWQKGAPFYDTGYLGPNGTDTLGKGNGILDWGEDINHNGVLDPGEDLNGNGRLDAERPGIANADQVIWYVCNDIGVAQPFSSPESGIEEQMTIWGYNRIDPLGHVIFKKSKLIYKGTSRTPANARIEKMYLMQFTDPDLGDSGDDFAGCDTLLNMMYVYNGKPIDVLHASFGLTPPACGYDLMQGPLVRGAAGEDRNRNGIDDASDWAIYGMKRVGPGFINLPMTAGEYETGASNDPPSGYANTICNYQIMRGLPPHPQGPPDPPMLTNPVTNLPTPFWLSGDPVAGTGWLDGIIDALGDRRIYMSSGPFDLALGESQEVVLAFVGGMGTNNINSITVMRFNDRFAQTAFDSLFLLPGPPANPLVDAHGLNDKIVLDWGMNSAAVAATESTASYGDYRFEGYKLYQFPDASGNLTSAKLLGQWDRVDSVTVIAQQVLDPLTGRTYLQPVQHGSDNGVVRNIVLSRDEFRGTPFIPNMTYYFAVTAYNYTPQPNPVRSYESAPVAFSVVPELPQPGTRFAYNIGDTVQVKNIVGVNDAQVVPVIYNPTRQRGAMYRLVFDSTSTGGFRWTFSDAGTGKIFYNKITDLSGTVPYGVSEAGFSLYVAAPKSGVKAVTNEKGQNVFGPQSLDSNYAILSATGMLEGFKSPSRQTATNYELRFDGRGSYVIRNGIPPSIAHGVYRAPFSTWDLGRTAADTPRQVIAWVKWDGVPAGRNEWNLDSAKVTIGGVSYTVFEAITITDLNYPPVPWDSLGVYALRTTVNLISTNGLDSNCAVYQVLFQDKHGTGAIPPTGTKVTFSKYLRIQNGDVKLVAPTPAVVADPTIARLDVAAIKAFPNPCYGAAQPGGPPFITFSHLPTHAIVRIFNLAGMYVRRLEKHDATTQFLRWDLRNESGKRVASGIYIVQIEMPELNTSRALKAVVILEATD